MGLILDTSVIVADERGKFDLPAFLRQHPGAGPAAIAAITASGLLHGVERAEDPTRKLRRQHHVQQVLATVGVLPFDLEVARSHARIWAELATRGTIIGAHDLQIAATAMSFNYELATLNVQEFNRVTGLKVIDATAFRRRQ
jgi:predicted nucleic acid-binding protein